jgi:hypothetical protein
LLDLDIKLTKSIPNINILSCYNTLHKKWKEREETWTMPTQIFWYHLYIYRAKNNHMQFCQTLFWNVCYIYNPERKRSDFISHNFKEKVVSVTWRGLKEEFLLKIADTCVGRCPILYSLLLKMLRHNPTFQYDQIYVFFLGMFRMEYNT